MLGLGCSSVAKLIDRLEYERPSLWASGRPDGSEGISRPALPRAFYDRPALGSFRIASCMG